MNSTIPDFEGHHRIPAGRLNEWMGLVRHLISTYWILLVLSVIWGLAFVEIKVVEYYLSPVNITLLRWFMASAGLSTLLPLFGRLKRKFEWKDSPRFLLVSAANVVGYHLNLNYSETSISAGMAVLLGALGPVFIIILASLILHEKQAREIIPILLLAFGGTFILSFGADQAYGTSTVLGILAAIGTAASYSIFAVFSKPLVQTYGALPLTVWVRLTGTAILLPLLSVTFISQIQALPVSGWLAMLYLSILSTVIGYTMFYTLVNRGTVSRLSIQLYLIPIVGVAGGVLFLGESVTVFTIAGGAAMLAAVAIITRKKQVGKNQKSSTY